MISLIQERGALPASRPNIDPRWMIQNGLEDGQYTDQGQRRRIRATLAPNRSRYADPLHDAGGGLGY